MEQKIETIIDNTLSSVSANFYIISIIIGVLLLIYGLITIFNKNHKKLTIGWICIVISILSILSGFIQINL